MVIREAVPRRSQYVHRFFYPLPNTTSSVLAKPHGERVMTPSPFVEPLRDADAFQKNVFVLFNDFVVSIREKTLSATIIDRQGPELYCGIDTVKMKITDIYIFLRLAVKSLNLS